MAIRLMTGNDALALGALHAGVKVVTGYPGTPSTGALASLLEAEPQGVHAEWSVNEKVAFDVAAGAAWAGQRALCTMKMSGLSVALDSLWSVAYSGTVGGLVIYVADDPGVSAGMVEQDSRGVAVMTDLPMLDPVSVQDAYDLTRAAFDLSEAVGTPVFVRLTTANSSSASTAEVDDGPAGPLEREALLLRDIGRFTKAGAAICMAQHRSVISRLVAAERWIAEHGLNRLDLAGPPGGIGIVTAGIAGAYLDEGFEVARRFGFDPQGVSTLRLLAAHPLPQEHIQALVRHCKVVLVLEELEPLVERGLYVEAHRLGVPVEIIGKISGHFERAGEYGLRHVVQGLAASAGLQIPPAALEGDGRAETLAAARPITVCAGCPHRGTFMAINQAVRWAGYKRDQVMVTGDIGCTILGMNPPCNTVWNEVSMGASVALAQGYVHAGVSTPVIATMGDSTFYHAGMTGLANAVQHQVPLTLIIMDNGWTSMTGMQTNPGTCGRLQAPGNARLDIARIVPALGVDQFWVVDPFDVNGMSRILQDALGLPGVKVLLARQECAIPARRRGLQAGSVRVVADNCNQCKLCITVTGCLAISPAEGAVAIDDDLCYGCGVCATTCNREAIEYLPAYEEA